MQLGGISDQPKTHDDAFMNYIYEQPRGNVDALKWWGEYGPLELRQMAFDSLSIPAMSAEVERIFSSAKRALTPDRNALTIDSLEMHELLRNWWRGDVVLQVSDAEEELLQHHD